MAGIYIVPFAINLYSEAIFQECILESTKGFLKNRAVANNLKYIDDTIVITENLKLYKPY